MEFVESSKSGNSFYLEHVLGEIIQCGRWNQCSADIKIWKRPNLISYDCRAFGSSFDRSINMVERVAGRRGASQWVLRHTPGEVDYYGQFGQCSTNVRLIKVAQRDDARHVESANYVARARSTASRRDSTRPSRQLLVASRCAFKGGVTPSCGVPQILAPSRAAPRRASRQAARGAAERRPHPRLAAPRRTLRRSARRFARHFSRYLHASASQHQLH